MEQVQAYLEERQARAVQIKLADLQRDGHMIAVEERQRANEKHSVVLSSQGISESSDELSSMVSGSNDSVDISG